MNQGSDAHFDFSQPISQVDAKPQSAFASSGLRRRARSVLDVTHKVSVFQHRVISFVLLVMLVVVISFALISIQKSKDNDAKIRSATVISQQTPAIYTGDGYAIRLSTVQPFFLRNDRAIVDSNIYKDKKAITNTWYLRKDNMEQKLMTIETMENVSTIDTQQLFDTAKSNSKTPDEAKTVILKTKQGFERGVFSQTQEIVRSPNSIYLITYIAPVSADLLMIQEALQFN